MFTVTLALASCRSNPQSFPTPTLRPALDFTEGHTASFEDKYLFVEYFVTADGTSSTSECPEAAMIDFPGYSYSNGMLNVYPAPTPGGQDIIGYAGFGQANQGAMGGGVSSHLELISSLPFALPYNVAVIHTLEATGEIVVEIQNGFYLMGKGESWIRSEEWDPTSDCHRMTVVRFTNFGLLDRGQIK